MTQYTVVAVSLVIWNRRADSTELDITRSTDALALKLLHKGSDLVQAGFDNSDADYICCSGRHGNRGRQPPLGDTWNWTDPFLSWVLMVYMLG